MYMITGKPNKVKTYSIAKDNPVNKISRNAWIRINIYLRRKYHPYRTDSRYIKDGEITIDITYKTSETYREKVLGFDCNTGKLNWEKK